MPGHCKWWGKCIHTLSPTEQATLRAIRVYYMLRCQKRACVELNSVLSNQAAASAATAVQTIIQVWIQGYRSAPMLQPCGHWLISKDEQQLLHCLQLLQRNDITILNSTVAKFVVEPFGPAFAASLQHLAHLLAVHSYTKIPYRPAPLFSLGFKAAPYQ